jgi:hypothetical protein
MQAPTTFPQQLPQFGKGVALLLAAVALAAIVIGFGVLPALKSGSGGAPALAGTERPYTSPEERHGLYIVASQADHIALLDVFDAFGAEATAPWERTSATRQIVVVTSAEQEAELEASVLQLNDIRALIGLPEVAVYDLR